MSQQFFPGDEAVHVKNGEAVRTVRVIRVSASVDRLGNPTGDVHAYVEHVSGSKPKNVRYDVNVSDLRPVEVDTADTDTDDRPVLATIRLTPFQREEVEHGLDVDYADDNGPIWGRVRRTGKSTAFLDVLDFNGAVYRMTSGRDIYADNAAGDGFGGDVAAATRARSLTQLVVKLVDAAGGPDVLDAVTRRWVRRGDFTVPAVEVEHVDPKPAAGDWVTVESNIGLDPVKGATVIAVNGDRVRVAYRNVDRWVDVDRVTVTHRPVTVENGPARYVEVERVEVDPNPVPVLDVEDAIAHLSDVCDLPPIDVLSGLVAGFDLIGPGHIYRMTSDGRVAIYVSLLKPSDFSY